MSFKNIDLKISYLSVGENSISEIINPLLSCTKYYKRSVGFFSSTVLNFIDSGIINLARNGGKIQLATCPKLSKQDIDAIYSGYIDRNNIKEKFISQFDESLDDLELNNLEILYELIKNNILDIKIVVKKNGLYHDKLAILEDFNGNTLAFVGSANESGTAYNDNYEKIRLYKSWTDFEGRIEDETREFNSIWDNSNSFLEIYDFMDALEKKIIDKIIYKKNKNKKEIKLRDYQKEAIQNWKNNNYHGFFVMATGTGKTFTSIFGLKQLIEEIKSGFIIICAPYKHLVSQWIEDLKIVFKDVNIVHISSDNPKWIKELNESIIKQKYKATNISIAVSTIKSFIGDKFSDIIDNYHGTKILVVDEAHRFNNYLSDDLHMKYKFMLGLSATPYSGHSTESGDKLIEFFGGKTFEYSLEQAIESKFLVPYNYYPIFVYATNDEEEKFNKLSKTMSSCFKNNKLIVPVKDFNVIRKARLRVISNSYNKRKNILSIISDNIKEKDHFIVYSGDGHITDSNDEIKFLQFIKNNLDNLDYHVAQFTSEESLQDRLDRIDSFNKGYIDALVAIKCLDEGINIPSIKSALIVSSSDDPKEFIQRRGRILRLYKDEFNNEKKFSNIYDIVVLPSLDCPNMAKIELRRFKEYNRLAMNYNDNIIKLKDLCDDYGLNINDLNFSAYEDNIYDGSDIDE